METKGKRRVLDAELHDSSACPCVFGMTSELPNTDKRTIDALRAPHIHTAASQ